MTGVIGALAAFAVVLGIVLVLAVRPAGRRFGRVAAAARADLAVRLDRLHALRRARPAHAAVVAVASGPSDDAVLVAPSAAPSAWGRGRHRRVGGAP